MVTLTKEAADILYDTATKIIIPEDYDEIDDKAFAGNLNIKEIIIPNTVKRIGEGAFSGCRNLRKISLPGIDIPGICFLNCTSLVDIEFKEGLKEIGVNAFMGCTALFEVNFPYSLEKIGFGAFKSSAISGTLNFAALPNLKVISKMAFSACYEIKDIIIGPTIEKIDERAFEGCLMLKQICILPNTKRNIIAPNFLRFAPSLQSIYADNDFIVENPRFTENYAEYLEDFSQIPIDTLINLNLTMQQINKTLSNNEEFLI